MTQPAVPDPQPRRRPPQRGRPPAPKPKARYCVGCGFTSPRINLPCIKCGTLRADFPDHSTKGACPICHQFTLVRTPYCEWCGSSQASWSV